MIVVEEFAATVKFSGVFEGTEIEHLRVNRKFNYVVSAPTSSDESRNIISYLVASGHYIMLSHLHVARFPFTNFISLYLHL